jgi:rSAM/selenodomain-associated transferase 1
MTSLPSLLFTGRSAEKSGKILKNMSEDALILFTRLPLPGQTKTRLMPWLSPEQCAALHRAMLADMSDALRRTGGADQNLFVYYTPEGDLSELRELCGDARYKLQRGEDLGERMDRAMRETFTLGYASCLLMGSDVPEATEDAVETAAALLRTHDAVLAPTEDGGYWLVGLKAPCGAIFAHRSYGAENALMATLKGCERAGLSVALGPRLRDIDRIEDLRDYAEHPGKTKPRCRVLIAELLRNLQTS